MPAAARVIILGCGYTGKRVAGRLIEQGHEVVATARNVASLRSPQCVALQMNADNALSFDQLDTWVTSGTRVLYSLPTIGSKDLTPQLTPYFSRAKRVVYISTTGVYGTQCDINETTRPDPHTSREWLRMEAENAIQTAFADSLVLRPAAIYGPHRGIHASMRAQSYHLYGNGANFVSRIHVDDLATCCIAGLFSDVQGAWPVADDEPCTSAEIAEFCARLLQLPLPGAASDEQLSETRRADRRVDGSAIRRALNVELQFPSYRVGIPACIVAESELSAAADRDF